VPRSQTILPVPEAVLLVLAVVVPATEGALVVDAVLVEFAELLVELPWVHLAGCGFEEPAVTFEPLLEVAVVFAELT
jgi:hypothetical protein